MTCPRCNAPLTAAEVATLHGKAQSAKRITKSGGKVWRNHNPNFPACRCPNCIARRAAATHFRELTGEWPSESRRPQQPPER